MLTIDELIHMHEDTNAVSQSYTSRVRSGGQTVLQMGTNIPTEEMDRHGVLSLGTRCPKSGRTN